MNKHRIIDSWAVATAVLLFTLSASATICRAQNRDHLTPKEVELVQEAQILDKRIDVFIRAIDRRFLAMSGSVTEAATKQLKKESETWGELPTGSRAELIGDMARILNEAITNIDDVNARDEKNPLIPKALRKLAPAAASTVERLRQLTKDDAETIGFEQLVKHAEEIEEAVAALPPPAEKKPKGKNKTEKPKETN